MLEPTQTYFMCTEKNSPPTGREMAQELVNCVALQLDILAHKCILNNLRIFMLEPFTKKITIRTICHEDGLPCIIECEFFPWTKLQNHELASENVKCSL